MQILDMDCPKPRQSAEMTTKAPIETLGTDRGWTRILPHTLIDMSQIRGTNPGE